MSEEPIEDLILGHPQTIQAEAAATRQREAEALTRLSGIESAIARLG